MSNKISLILIILGVSVVSLLNSFFIVDQRQVAIVFQFGEAVRIEREAGLSMKVPFIQNVEFFDTRVLNVDAEAKELTASDEKRIIVDAFAKYKITDPIQFYKTVRDEYGIKVRLNRVLESSMRKIIGRYPLITLLTVERSNIINQIQQAVNEESKDFGIDVIDVRILRADLPKENSEAIYRRMQTDREKEARQIRAEGREESQRIMSQADRDKRVILAEAMKQSNILHGMGDAIATKNYNSSYSQDPDFYKFYRSIGVYKESLTDEKTKFILSPNSEFFQYLKLNNAK